MKKLMLALVAGCLTAAVGAYAASGSPADSDKAGRMGPGTSAGQHGATDPSPGKSGAKGATSSTGAASSTTGAGAGGSAATTGSGASTTSGAGGASATTGGGMDDTKSGRRARRASKG